MKNTMLVEVNYNSCDEYENVLLNLAKMNKCDVYASAVIEEESLFDVFNNYIINLIDIDLEEYKVLTEVNLSENNLVIDLDLLKEDCEEEYLYIIDELKRVFGRSIIRRKTEAQKMQQSDGTINLNIKVMLRTAFKEAYEINVKDEIIEVKMSPKFALRSFIFKYCLSN